MTLDGRVANQLGDYVVTTPIYQLDAGNVWSANATPSILRGYFVAIHPLSRGTHTLRLYDEYSEFGLAFALNIELIVG